MNCYLSMKGFRLLDVDRDYLVAVIRGLAIES